MVEPTVSSYKKLLKNENRFFHDTTLKELKSLIGKNVLITVIEILNYGIHYKSDSLLKELRASNLVNYSHIEHLCRQTGMRCMAEMCQEITEPSDWTVPVSDTDYEFARFLIDANINKCGERLELSTLPNSEASVFGFDSYYKECVLRYSKSKRGYGVRLNCIHLTE